MTAENDIANKFLPNDALYRLLVQNLPGSALLVFDHALRYLVAEGAFLEALGFVPNDLIGKTLQEVVSPDVQVDLLPHYQAALEGKESEIEGQLGSYSYRARMVPVRANDGEIIAGMVVAQDITTQKQAEQALKNSEARYRLLAEHSSDLVILVDLAHTYEYVSLASKTILGYEPDELLGKTSLDLVHPDDMGLVLNDRAAALTQTGPAKPLMLRFRHKQGHYVWLERTSQPVHSDLNQALTHMVVTLRDVTLRRQAEEALRESEDRYRTVVAALSEGIVLQTQNGEIRACNAAAERILGLSADQMAGLTSVDPRWQAIHEDGSPFPGETHPPMVTLKTGQSHQNVIMGVHKPDGALTWISVNSRPLIKPGETVPYAVVSSFVDVTAAKQDSDRLAQSEKRYRQLFDQIGDVIIIHDLQGRLLDVNAAACRKLGYSYNELRRMSIWDLDEPGFAVHFPDRLKRQLAEGTLSNIQGVHRHRDGHQIFIDVNSTVIDYRGQTAVLSACRDITELRQATQALAAKEEKFRAFVEQSSEGMMLLDEQGRIIEWNAACEHMTGLKREAVLGQFFWDVQYRLTLPEFQSPSRYEAARTMIIEALHNHQSPLFNALIEAEIYSAQGKRKTIQQSIFPIRTGQGYRIGSISLDITERKQVEMALRQSEATEHEQRLLAETLRDTASALNSTLNPEQVLALILEYVDRILPYDLASILLIEGDIARPVYCRGWNQEAEAAFKALRIPLDTPNLRTILATGQPVIISDTTSSPGWIDFLPGIRSYIGVPIRTHGQIIGILDMLGREPALFTRDQADRLAIFADQAAMAVKNAQLYEAIRQRATELETMVNQRTMQLASANDALRAEIVERQRTEERLAESLSLLQAAFESTADGLLMVDNDRQILRFNRVFTDMWGIPIDSESTAQDEHFIAVSIKSVNDPSLFLERIDFWHRSQDARGYDTLELRDGRIIERYTQPLTIGAQIVGRVWDFRDITERTRVERELRELNRLKTEFLSTAAHELRTPLTAVKGFSEILVTRKVDSDRQQRYLRLILDQSTHLGHLIDDLLDLTRLEAKRGLSLALRHFRLDSILQETVTPFIEAGTPHQFNLDVAADVPEAFGDPFRVMQVFQNLLSNAVKYSPEGGSVTVTIRHAEGNIAVQVSDTGIGMTPEQLSHLFERFYRADASNTSLSGTGLGLAICKAIVELHGGQIYAESQPGIGTTISFNLPVVGPGSSGKI